MAEGTVGQTADTRLREGTVVPVSGVVQGKAELRLTELRRMGRVGELAVRDERGSYWV